MANRDPLLSGVSETLLIPLYYRALESQRPDAILKDEKAVELTHHLDYDFSQLNRIRTHEGNKVARFLLTREMDRYTRNFLESHPDAVVVHIGCGLDSRYERVDNGRVEWFDLDLPEVIELRRRYLGSEAGRYHLFACSVFDDAWLDVVKALGERPILLVAEAVLVYFTESQVRGLVLKLKDRLPGVELVFDAWSPFFVRLGNFQLSQSKFAGKLQWGVWHARHLESWGEGIKLVGQWGFFEAPEPRMAPYRWVAPLFWLFKPMRIFHYRLGEKAD